MKTIKTLRHSPPRKVNRENGGKDEKVPENDPQNTPNFDETAKSGVSDRGNLRVIRYFVTPDGLPEFDRMQQKTREELKEFVGSETVRKGLGLVNVESQAAAISEVGFDEDEANALFDALGPINAFAASKMYGVKMEICLRAFTFTPEQRQKINPRTIRLMNKWGPSILKTWKEEIGAGIVMLAIINAQVRTMHLMVESEKRAGVRPVDNRPRASTPAPAPAPAPAASPMPTQRGFPEPERESPAKVETEAPKPDMLDTIGFGSN